MTSTADTIKKKVNIFVGKIGNWIKRHKKLFIFLVAIVLIVGILLVVFGNMQANAASGLQMPQTVTLSRMDLEQIVSGTGTLQSSVTRNVTSGLSYDIKAVYVKEGDTVMAGQVLALIDSTELDKKIAETKKSISEAQASDKLALQQAERKLQDAKNTRDINWSKNDAAVQSAFNTLTTANSALAAANSKFGTAQGERDSRNTALQAAKNADSSDPGYATNLQVAQSAFDTAEAALTAAKQEQSTAKQAVSTAQDAYSKAVETRDTTYRNDSISIENAQDAVDSQKLRDSAESYKTQLEGYEDDKEKCSITAPIDGAITAMTAAVGSSAGGSAAGASGASGGSSLFTIEDTKRLEISASVPEYDAVTLQTGLRAEITSDAISKEEWTGTVKSISPKASDDSGNFTVVIEVISPVGKLAIGMSTKVNIITAEQANVFAVPYDAVTTNEKGENVIYVMDTAMMSTTGQGMPAGGQPARQRASAGGEENTATPIGREIVVKTGMETDYYIEITSDELEEGMQILADPKGKNASNDSGLAGGFMMGGGF